MNDADGRSAHEARNSGDAGDRGVGGVDAEGGAAPDQDEATRVVVRPAGRDPEPDRDPDDATRVVVRPAGAGREQSPEAEDAVSRSADRERDPAPDDATRVVVRSAGQDPEPDDATRVVARPRAEEPSPGTASASGPLSEQVQDDVTRAVSRAVPDPDATLAVGMRAPEPSPSPAGEGGGAASARDAVGTPAPPVAEPIDRRELPQEMFKPPLDPRRRARRSPFPQEEHTLPRRGVRPGMPVVYGARPEYTVRPRAELDPDSPLAVIGPPPQSDPGAPDAAERAGLPSTERSNRRFAVTAVVGGATVVVVVLAGLAGIAWLAFG